MTAQALCKQAHAYKQLRTCKNIGTFFPQCAEETSLWTVWAALIPCIPEVFNIGKKACADARWVGWTNDRFTGWRLAVRDTGL